jgi:hypothetical protein
MFHDSLIDENLNFSSYIMTMSFWCWQATITQFVANLKLHIIFEVPIGKISLILNNFKDRI